MPVWFCSAVGPDCGIGEGVVVTLERFAGDGDGSGEGEKVSLNSEGVAVGVVVGVVVGVSVGDEGELALVDIPPLRT